MNNFAVFKNDRKKSDKEPDYTISLKIGDEYKTAGACWLKDGKKGKYFSCKLQDAYNDRPAYEIIEVAKDAFLPQKPTTNDYMSTKDPSTTDINARTTSKSEDYPEGIDIDKDMPF